MEEDEEGRRGVPSGQTTPDGPSVLPTDRFLPPTQPRKTDFYQLEKGLFLNTECIHVLDLNHQY